MTNRENIKRLVENMAILTFVAGGHPEAGLWPKIAPAPKTGKAGGPPSPNAHGPPSARTIRRTATRGIISPTIKRAAARIAGVRTGCWGFAIASAGCVLPSRFGTVAIRS